MTAARAPKIDPRDITDMTSTALLPLPGVVYEGQRPAQSPTDVQRAFVSYLGFGGPMGYVDIKLETFRDGIVHAFLPDGRKLTSIPIDLLRCAPLWPAQRMADIEVANGARERSHLDDAYV